MIKSTQILLCLAALLAYSSWPVHGIAQGIAQKSDTDAWPDRNSFSVFTTRSVPVRAAPPSEGFLFLGSPGKETSALKPGEKVEITGFKEVETLFSKYVWVQIKKTDPSGRSASGWAYWGNTKENPVNFEAQNKEK